MSFIVDEMEHGRNIRISFIVFSVVLVILHLVTLPISPLPWFDEVIFADITNSYVTTGKMEMTVVPEYYKGEVYQYGPIYFQFQGLIIKTFGLGPVSFRMLNLVAGLDVVFILYVIFKRNITAPIAAYGFAALVLLDTIFNQSLHSGRMDLVALCFAVCCLMQADGYKRDQKITRLILVGVFGAVAFLTTPRALFLLTAPAVLLMLRTDEQTGKISFDTSIFRNGAIVLAIFIAIVFATIEFTVGLSEYFTGMTGASKNGKPITEFIGGQLLRETYENHVIILMIVAIVFFYKTVLRSPLIISLIVAFIAFSLFVNETGPYSAMIMPFVYFVLVALLLSAKPKLSVVVIVGLLMINAGIFFLKTTIVLASMERRNVNSQLYSTLNSIPEGSKILSSFRFYYWSVANKSPFESYAIFNGPEKDYVEHIVYEYRPDYVIVGPYERQRLMFIHADFVNYYEPFGEITLDDSSSGKLERLAKSFIQFDDNFECVIYKRKDY